MNVEFCGDNSGRSKKMSYFRKNKGTGRAPPLDPPLLLVYASIHLQNVKPLSE